MRELSLNVLDIAQNSVTAGASLIEIIINIYDKADRFEIIVRDNGKGIKEDFLKNITDPFVTTRTTRKVGMGLPLFKFSAEQSGGSFTIKSEVGKGTEVKAEYIISSVDRMPLGDIGETVLALILSNENIDFLFKVTSDKGEGYLDTREVKKTLGGVSVTNSEVISFLKEYIQENISFLFGGLV